MTTSIKDVINATGAFALLVLATQIHLGAVLACWEGIFCYVYHVDKTEMKYSNQEGETSSSRSLRGAVN